jgi:hypothetical protein
LIVWRMPGSSSARSRGRLITISLCFRFTELSSTLNFLPAWTTSARPYPVMLLILDTKVYARETLDVQCPTRFCDATARTHANCSVTHTSVLRRVAGRDRWSRTCKLLNRVWTTRRCGEGIATRPRDSNHLWFGDSFLGACPWYTTSFTW